MSIRERCRTQRLHNRAFSVTALYREARPDRNDFLFGPRPTVFIPNGANCPKSRRHLYFRPKWSIPQPARRFPTQPVYAGPEMPALICQLCYD